MLRNRSCARNASPKRKDEENITLSPLTEKEKSIQTSSHKSFVYTKVFVYVVSSFVIVSSLYQIFRHDTEIDPPYFLKFSTIAPAKKGDLNDERHEAWVSTQEIKFSTLSPAMKGDISDDLYARKTLTGYYTFVDSQACRLASESICIVRYPCIDIQDVKKDDEAASAQPYPVPTESSLLSSAKETNGDRDALLDPNCAILTRRGYRGGLLKEQVNQDRLIILSPFYTGQDQPKPSNHADFLMGIFDGHGDKGHMVSHSVVLNLPRLLSNHLSEIATNLTDESVKQALVKTFIEVDSTIPSHINRIGGCTASVILRLNSKLYAANVGDSQSFIASYTRSTKSVEIVYMTRRDKPLLEDEKNRIEKAGGKITGTGPLASRVVVPRPGIGAVTLGMSRAIGDRDGRSVGVIPEPIVDVLQISDLLGDEGLRGSSSSNGENSVELFAVTASDGIYDYISKDEVAQYLAKSLYNESDTDIAVAVENLVMESSHRWIKRSVGNRDDISIAVNKIIV